MNADGIQLVQVRAHTAPRDIENVRCQHFVPF
jgi:hypothetical protein